MKRSGKTNGARPYAERLMQQKIQTITAHREDAARTVAALACVTLNDIDHWGKDRLSRFALALMNNVHEYYSDRERMDTWLSKRLEALGFEPTEGESIPSVLNMEWVQVKKGATREGW